jgi:ribosomal-protein-alanine N-acetyltransferase
MKLENKNVFIELLHEGNCDCEKYLKWMNNYEVVKYTSSKFRTYKLEDIKNYIHTMNHSTTDFLFGIFVDNEHVGNLKIGFIDYINRTCELGLIIGDEKYWGKGIATKVIELGVKFAFNYLDLFKIKAGMVECNKGSYKAFLKNGFKEVGRWKKEFFINRKRFDHILVEKLKEG